MFRRIKISVFFLLMLGAGFGFAQDVPVVQVALFYSPTCPHCHTIIDEYLPPIQAKYGDALEIFYINVQEQSGAMLFWDACDALGVPEARCGGVPFMVIGDAHMVGSAEIPARMESLIEAGLVRGGQNLSTLPLFWEVLQAQTATQGAPAEPDTTPTAAPLTWQARFASDLTANSLAVGVLVLLVASLLMVGYAIERSRSGVLPAWLSGKFNTRLIIGVVLGVAALSFSIALADARLPSWIATTVGGAALAVAASLSLRARSAWGLVAWLGLAGLLVAIYMSYIEVGQQEAVCGLVGNCNAVQASPYAQVFGVPIGVMGVLGYALILGAWFLSGRTGGRLAHWSAAALLGMLLFGVAFSAYLTFLEPFVIGASCAWCLTSALVMVALLWMATPSALGLLVQQQPPHR